MVSTSLSIKVFPFFLHLSEIFKFQRKRPSTFCEVSKDKKSIPKINFFSGSSRKHEVSPYLADLQLLLLNFVKQLNNTLKLIYFGLLLLFFEFEVKQSCFYLIQQATFFIANQQVTTSTCFCCCFLFLTPSFNNSQTFQHFVIFFMWRNRNKRKLN